jgi:acetyl-CoA C-acetyltransferase
MLAHVFKAVLAQAPSLEPAAIDDVLAGCANQAGEASLMLAGGVESMSRAPYVVSKAASAFARNQVWMLSNSMKRSPARHWR